MPREPRHWRENDLQIHLHPRRARAQSQEHLGRAAARKARGDHRAVGLRQVLARLRHDLCRGPAPLCRVALGLCAPVPRHDAEARRRSYRRAVSCHLHRAEDHLQEPTLDGRHGHRDLRLYAAPVGARRHPLFAGDRAPHREPDGEPDGRPRAGAARGHAALSARADRTRAEGRVPQGLRRSAEEGLPAGQGRRQVLRDRRGPCPRQAGEARHRRGRRSRGGARGRERAARRQFRDGARLERRHRHRRVRRQASGLILRDTACGRSSG